MEPTANPDIAWYMNISRERGVSPRCPFATAERCPRYYHSLSLLGDAGSTKIPAAEDELLRQQWEKSDLLPKTAEYDTGMFGNGERWFTYSNFCPEIIYDRFGLFASGLSEHYDEIDRDIAHQWLSKENWPRAHWQWMWASAKSQHFTECPLYSLLIHSPERKENRREEVVTLRPTFMGMSMNINELARRIWPWFRKLLDKRS